MELRDYQIEGLRQVSDHVIRGGARSVLLTMPTGSGKTATAAAIIKTVADVHGECSLFVVHMVELVKQTVRHLEALGLAVGVIQGDNTRHPKGRSADCYVATIQSIDSQGWPPLMHPTRPARYIFIDETHVWHQRHSRLIDEKLPDARVIGLTATPLRANLGEIYQQMVVPITIRELTDQGYLSPLTIYCPQQADMSKLLEEIEIDYRAGDFKNADLGQAMSRKKIIGDVVSTWQDKGQDRQTIGFACNVAHAQLLCDAFIAEGIDAATVTYRTPENQRQEIIARFRAGELQMLWSVDALAIGFDVPAVSCGIMARPTLSETVYLQQAGRLIRITENKADAILLDHAGNALRFGRPVDFEPPPLGTEEVKAGKKTLKLYKLKTCPNCEAAMPPGEMTCGECGHDLPGRGARVDALPGELAELGEPAAPREKSQAEKRQWYAELRFIGQQYKRNPKAAAARFKDKFGHFPPWEWNIDPIAIPSAEVRNFDKYHSIRFAKSCQRDNRSA